MLDQWIYVNWIWLSRRMIRPNIDFLEINEIKWMEIIEFNSNDCYFYYSRQESLRRNGVTLRVNRRIWNIVFVCSLKNDKVVLVHFQGKTFNLTVIQVYIPTTDAEETEIDRFYKDLQDLLEHIHTCTHTHTHTHTHTKHDRGLECKSRKSRDTQRRGCIYFLKLSAHVWWTLLLLTFHCKSRCLATLGAKYAVRTSLCESARNEHHLVECCHPKMRPFRAARAYFTCQLTSDTQVSWAEIRPTESSSAEAFHWSTHRQEPGETITTSWLPSATWWHVTPGPSFRQRSSLWCGNTDSKAVGYQRSPNPREYQTVITPTKETTWI